VVTDLPHGQTLTIIRGSKNLRTGVFEEASRHDIEGCAVDWSSGTGGTAATAEATGTQATTTLAAIVYAPYGADVRPADMAFFDGDESEKFDVTGKPQPWLNPYTGSTPGTVIKLINHEG
jgi:hypothetical protein